MKFCACGVYFSERRDAPDLRNQEARSDHFHRFSRYNIQVQQGTGRLFDGLRHGFRGEDRAAAPVFAGEWHRGMRPVISVTKHGRRRTAAAKVLAALAFCLEMVGVTAAGSVLCQVIFLGTEGWDMPVQFIKLLAAVPWNMLQAEIYEYVFLLIGGLGFTAVTLLISSLAKSTFAALVLSLGVLYVPMAVSQYLPLWGQKLLELLPMVGNSLDIFRTEVYHVFGQIIWSPWMLLAVPFLIGLCCVPAAFWGWCRRQR